MARARKPLDNRPNRHVQSNPQAKSFIFSLHIGGVHRYELKLRLLFIGKRMTQHPLLKIKLACFLPRHQKIQHRRYPAIYWYFKGHNPSFCIYLARASQF